MYNMWPAPFLVMSIIYIKQHINIRQYLNYFTFHTKNNLNLKIYKFCIACVFAYLHVSAISVNLVFYKGIAVFL